MIRILQGCFLFALFITSLSPHAVAEDFSKKVTIEIPNCSRGVPEEDVENTWSYQCASGDSQLIFIFFLDNTDYLVELNCKSPKDEMTYLGHKGVKTSESISLCLKEKYLLTIQTPSDFESELSKATIGTFLKKLLPVL